MTRRRTPPSPRRDAAIGFGVLAVIAATFAIAYDALTGLPGQRHYTVTVAVPAAQGLYPTAEARIAGLRVGQVLTVKARSAAGSPTYAEVKLQFKTQVAPITTTATVRVRPSSVLGANYIEVIPGRGGRSIPDGGHLPRTQGRTGPQVTDLLDVFEKSTALNLQTFMKEASSGVAGRGVALNRTIASLTKLPPALTRLSKTLAPDSAGLPAFINAADNASGVLAHHRSALGVLTTALAKTARGLADGRRDLADSIAASPSAIATTTNALERVQPALTRGARILTAVRPAAGLLPDAVRSANQVLASARPVFRATPSFVRSLRQTVRALRVTARASATDGAIRKAAQMFDRAAPLISTLADAQVGCNLVAVWAENFAAAFGDVGEGVGPSMLNVQFTNLGANGEILQNAKPATDLASNYYARNDLTECESGNEPWGGKQQLTNPATREPSSTRNTDPPSAARERARQAGLLDEDPR